MTFQDYLTKTKSIATEELEVLDLLSMGNFDKIAIRAAKSSLQVMIENAMIHDYMTFNNEILIDIVKNKKYINVFNFLIDECKYSDLIHKRIQNYSF